MTDGRTEAQSVCNMLISQLATMAVLNRKMDLESATELVIGLVMYAYPDSYGTSYEQASEYVAEEVQEKIALLD